MCIGDGADAGGVVTSVTAATRYSTLLSAVFPARSLAVTVKVRVPRDAVFSGEPSSTVPTHVTAPEQEKSTTTRSPCRTPPGRPAVRS